MFAQNQSRAKKAAIARGFIYALPDDIQWTQHVLSPIRGAAMTTEQRIERLEQTNRRYREGTGDDGMVTTPSARGTPLVKLTAASAVSIHNRRRKDHTLRQSNVVPPAPHTSMPGRGNVQCGASRAVRARATAACSQGGVGFFARIV